MSVKIMSRVWDHSAQDGSTLLVLLALADHADEDGVCWPGIERIAAKARVSERQAQRVIKTLEDKGELLTQFQRGQRGGRGYTNRYLITTGMSAYEIEQALVKRFEVEPALASRVADYLIDLQNGGNIEGKKAESDPRLQLPWIVCKKGDIQGKKRKRVTSRVKRVTSRDEKGDIAMSYEPSENRKNEPSVHEDSPISEKALSPAQKMFTALAEVCRCNIKLMRGHLNKAEKELREAGIAPETIDAFGVWWYENDFRGKQDQPPTLKQVRETLGQFEAFQVQPEPTPLFPPPDPDSPLPEAAPLSPEEAILERFKDQARLRMSADAWETHIKPLAYLDHPGDVIRLACGPFAKEWLDGRLGNILDPIAAELTPGGFEYVVT